MAITYRNMNKAAISRLTAFMMRTLCSTSRSFHQWRLSAYARRLALPRAWVRVPGGGDRRATGEAKRGRRTFISEGAPPSLLLPIFPAPPHRKILPLMPRHDLPGPGSPRAVRKSIPHGPRHLLTSVSNDAVLHQTARFILAMGEEKFQRSEKATLIVYPCRFDDDEPINIRLADGLETGPPCDLGREVIRCKNDQGRGKSH